MNGSLKPYRWPLLVVAVGIAGLVCALSVEELRAVKIDWAGAMATGYGLMDYLIRRNRENLKTDGENQTAVTIVSVGAALEKLRKDIKRRHIANRKVLASLAERMRTLELHVDGRIADKASVLADHDRRLGNLERGHVEILTAVRENTDSLKEFRKKIEPLGQALGQPLKQPPHQSDI